MKTLMSLVLLGSMTLLLPSCALTPEKIDLVYTPASNAVVVEGAAGTELNVVVNDVRARTDRVASKVNGYGQEMAAISLNQDVSKLVEDALELELRNRGFNVNGSGVQVVAEVYDFQNEFQSGFWSGTALASVRLNIKVRNASGVYTFSEMIVGQGRKEKIQLATGKNAQPALDEALRNAMKALFERDDFYSAIRKAGS